MTVLTLRPCADGEIAEFTNHRGKACSRKVVAVIKAPRGQAIIFDPGVGNVCQGAYEGLGEVVRVFMEQHRDGC